MRSIALATRGHILYRNDTFEASATKQLSKGILRATNPERKAGREPVAFVPQSAVVNADKICIRFALWEDIAPLYDVEDTRTKILDFRRYA